MRQAWQQQHLQPLVCRETVSELLRVLAYPKFKLSNLEQQELLADFLPYADVVELPAPWPDLPVCRDDKDQVFLVLAHVGKADALITGDADILAMREDFPGLIMTAEAFAARQA
jgi:putative PIN family toxin of toxin-antitoxin system